MKKWIFAGIFAALLVVVFFRQQNLTAPQESSPPLNNVISEVKPTLGPPPAPRIPSSGRADTFRDRMDPQIPLQVGRKRYELSDSLVAMDLAQAKKQGIEIHKILGAWALVNITEATLPNFPVVKQVGSENLGVFRGVLKTMSLEILSENGPWSVCPGEILSAQPEIKVYLIQLKEYASPEELRQCLDETRLFSRLEWEIIDQPRGLR